MGYYIQVPENKGKAQQIVDLYGGRIVGNAPRFSDIAKNEAIICVLNNGLFEVAGFAFDPQELAEFSYPDGRPRMWVIMNRQKACELTGYIELEGD